MNFSILRNGILTISVASFLFSCGRSEKSNSAKPEVNKPISVQVDKPVLSSGNGGGLTGRIVAAQSANISTRIMGTILSIPVKVGDVVQTGQILATIKASDLQAKKAQTDAMIEEAAAHMKQAQKDYDRYKNLYDQKSASPKELEQMSLQLTASKARFEAALQTRNEVYANMQYTTLTAPFSGVITQKYMNSGDLASPGVPLLQLEGSGVLEIQALAPESLIGKIKKGDILRVTAGSANKVFDASISEVSPSATATGGQYPIKIIIPTNEKKGLLAGMYVNIALPNTTSNSNNNSFHLPLSSLVHKDDLVGVYTLGADSTAQLRWLRVGKTIGNQVEILSGLASNETFIVSSQTKLFNGAKVVVQ